MKHNMKFLLGWILVVTIASIGHAGEKNDSKGTATVTVNKKKITLKNAFAARDMGGFKIYFTEKPLTKKNLDSLVNNGIMDEPPKTMISCAFKMSNQGPLRASVSTQIPKTSVSTVFYKDKFTKTWDLKYNPKTKRYSGWFKVDGKDGATDIKYDVILIQMKNL